MKKVLVTLSGMLFLLMTSGLASAGLVTIGTAQLEGTGPAYNLIWDDDNNGNSIVWLDYSHAPDSWQHQGDWAAAIGTGLAVALNPSFTTDIDWTTGWRLPSPGADPQYDYDDAGSEMGHLFYTELGLESFGTTGQEITKVELNASAFDNLEASETEATWYWSNGVAVTYPLMVWAFDYGQGYQFYSTTYYNGYGIAVHEGQVVPEPGAIWLLGTVLTGLVVLRRKTIKLRMRWLSLSAQRLARAV